MEPPDLSSLTRDQRLRREASNCLTIAIRERDCDMVAQLIDEALRLAERARAMHRDTNAQGETKAEGETTDRGKRAGKNMPPILFA